MASASHPDGPFLVTADGTDGLTRKQTRHRSLLLTSRGVRLPESLAADDEQLWLAVQLPLRAECALSYATASRLLHLPLPRRLDRVIPAHVTAPRDTPRPRRRDVITHHARLAESEITQIGDLRLTVPARTYVDMASMLRFPELVALGDVVLRDHGITPVELTACAQARLRYPGRRLALAAIGWLDAAAASPRESHLRVLLRRARLPRPEVNARIADEWGGFLAIGDLVFREHRVIVEYDGEVHAPMRQRAKDAARRALLRQHGWIVVEIVGEDMHYPARVVARVRDALRDGRRGGSGRSTRGA